MTRLGQQQSATSKPRAACSAARWILALISVLSCWTVVGGSVMAQSSEMHQLFDEVPNGAANTEWRDANGAPFADDPVNGAPAQARPSPSNGMQRGLNQPPANVQGMLPLAGSDATNDVQLSQNPKTGLITLIVRDATLSRVLSLLAQAQGLNIVAANDIDAIISITVRDVPLEEALTAILSVANYTWVRKNNIILVTSIMDSSNLPADVQGRQIQVFELDFASAASVATSVTGFLSPIGKVTTDLSDPKNNRRTRESVIVEDLPESLARIAAYIHYVDQSPRQVLLEAHILEVRLDDTNKQGIDWNALLRISNQTLDLKTVGMASASASPAFLATLEGGDLGAVIELIENSTDSKSLGSPKILVLNEQEARVQVGRQDGYLGGTVTTETSTTQNVQFLDTGVLLRLTPRITRDNRVLLHVAPEVSDGRVTEGLPNKTTTQLETDVMLKDGQGMIIGGLIKELDSTTQSKIPYLGDVRVVGWFFRRSEVKKERTEVIVALVPRIQPYCADYQAFEQGELVRAGTQLMRGPLCRTDRPWDVVLPDGKRVYRPLIPELPKQECGPYYYNRNLFPPCSENRQFVVPPHPMPLQRFGGRDCDLENCEPNDPGPGRAFLSDEALPEPAPALRQRSGNQGWETTEIISDHQ